MIPTIAPYLLPKVIENLARLHPSSNPYPRDADAEADQGGRGGPARYRDRRAAGVEPSLTEVALFTENFLLCGGEARNAGAVERCCARCAVAAREDIASATRRCRSATCNPRRARVLDASSLSTLVRWSAPHRRHPDPGNAVAVETARPRSRSRASKIRSRRGPSACLAQDQSACRTIAADRRGGLAPASALRPPKRVQGSTKPRGAREGRVMVVCGADAACVAALSR